MKILLSYVITIASITFLMAQQEATLLDHWSDSSLVGSTTFDNTYNEVWGYTQDGHEYAVIGTTWGTHIFELTDDDTLALRAEIPGVVQGGVIIHRDYHDYQGHLYTISDEGNGNVLQIIDMTHLPERAPVVYSDDAVIARAHNIFIDTVQGLLYGLISRGGSPGNYDPLRVYDISDPTDPQFLRAYSEIGGVGFSQVHDGHILDGRAYLNLGPGGVMIADFTDPMDASLLSFLSTADYPQSGYNHSGWPTEDGDYYFFADETWGTDIKVLDVQDPTDPSVIATLDAGNDLSNSIAHNQVIACDYLYVSYYYDGLQVYDISNPEFPERVFFYQTSNIPHRRSYEGAWGVYPFFPSGRFIVSDMQEGLFLFDAIDTDCAATSVHTQELLMSVQELRVSPNPVMDGQLYIDHGGQAIEQLIIRSILGQQIISAPLIVDDRTISVADLRSGSYLLTAVMDGQPYQAKILVLH